LVLVQRWPLSEAMPRRFKQAAAVPWLARITGVNVSPRGEVASNASRTAGSQASDQVVEDFGGPLPHGDCCRRASCSIQLSALISSTRRDRAGGAAVTPTKSPDTPKKGRGRLNSRLVRSPLVAGDPIRGFSKADQFGCATAERRSGRSGCLSSQEGGARRPVTLTTVAGKPWMPWKTTMGMERAEC